MGEVLRCIITMINNYDRTVGFHCGFYLVALSSSDHTLCLGKTHVSFYNSHSVENYKLPEILWRSSPILWNVQYKTEILLFVWILRHASFCASASRTAYFSCLVTPWIKSPCISSVWSVTVFSVRRAPLSMWISVVRPHSPVVTVTKSSVSRTFPSTRSASELLFLRFLPCVIPRR